jgi:hypothetical protein
MSGSILAGDVTIAAKKTDTHLNMGAQAEARNRCGARTRQAASTASALICLLIAAGYSDEAARKGCSDDFEQAAYLIDY